MELGDKPRVLLGVTGGVAAYKAAELASLLTQRGVAVRTVMTEAAAKFIAPLTFAALTDLPVAGDMFQADQEATIGHIELARWADAVVVAPATANTLAKAAAGQADNLLTTILLATRAPILMAPAMNPQMYAHPATSENIAKLAGRGVLFLGPEPGRTACGEEGPGRMSQPTDLADAVQCLVTPHDLEGVKVLITSGPTREHLDPVRYISNPSSGRMGIELARFARRRGAEVWLVLGPTHLPDPWGVHTVRVTSAQEMQEAVLRHAADAEVSIMAAAVSDFRPTDCAPQKIKKGDRKSETCELVRTPDILAHLSRTTEGQILVGFAAETEDIVANAQAKLKAKKLDLLVANDVTDPASGFAVSTNRVRIITPDGRVESLPLLPKWEVAQRILNRVSRIIERRRKKS